MVRELLLFRGGFDVRRAFHPAPDMMELLRRKGLPWVDLERGDPVAGSRVVGFGLPSEMLFTNLLSLLDLMGLPLRSADRGETAPLIIAGGGGISNPIPLMPFVDAFFLGDAEAGSEDVFEILAGEGSRGERLIRVASMKGVLVPGVTSGPVRPARIGSLEECRAPVTQIVPTGAIVHDRAVVEIARGCTRGCRFCQAGQLSRPVRERTPETCISLMEASLDSTGYEEGGFLSLSYSDYSGIDQLSGKVAHLEKTRGVRLSQPSLRPDTLRRMAGGRNLKGKVTIAPEAGSPELRKRIGKPFTDQEILEAVRAAAAMGATGVKLYFMVGLPWETDEDLLAVGALAERAARLGRRRWEVSVSLSPFVPKPHTPLQWAAQQPPDEVRRRMKIVRSRCRRAKVSWNDPDAARIEAAIALGGHDFPEILQEAYGRGAVFDAWTDLFRGDIWYGLVPSDPPPPPGLDEPLPWAGVVETGVCPDWLVTEYRRAEAGVVTPDCREGGCTGCGACSGVIPDLPSGTPEVSLPGTPAADPAAARLRIRYSKQGLARFTSHLDSVRMWGRAVRRACIPVCLGAGFVRRPGLKFGYPLPLGMTSRAEYLDIMLRENLDPGEAMTRLNSALPEGFSVLGAKLVPVAEPSPDTGVTVEYFIAGVETGILRGAPGVLETRGEKVRVDGSRRESRPDRLLEAMGVEYGPVERTEVYSRGASDQLVPLIKLSEGKGRNVCKG